MLPFLRSWRQDRLLRGVIQNSSYLFSSSTISAILSAGQSILIARLLGPVDYGIVTGVVIVVATNVNRLLSFRMSEVVVKYWHQYLAEGRKDRAAAMVKAAGLTEAVTSILAYLVLILLAPLAARYLAKDTNTLPLFVFYGLVLLSNLIYETSTGVLQACGHFDRLATVNLSQSVVTATAILLAFVFKGGMVAVLAAYLLGKTVAGGAIVFFAWRELKKQLGDGWQRVSWDAIPHWRELASFAVNTNLHGTVNLAVRDSETLWIAGFLSPLEAGYFRLALSVITLVMMPIDPFIGPTYAQISRTIAQRQWQLTTRLLKRVSLLAAAWTLSAGGFLALFGWWVIPFIYTAKYRPAYPAFVILLIGYGFANIFQWNRPLLLALGKPGYPFQVSAVTGVIKTVLTLTLTPVFGYLAESAILSAYFVASISLILRRGLVEIRQRAEISAPVEEAPESSPFQA